jgi:hypothetical protein
MLAKCANKIKPRESNVILFSDEFWARREKQIRDQAKRATVSIAFCFLKKLRRRGPWVLTAIEPDGRTVTITARTKNEVGEFIAQHDGRRNLYYSVNPTRKPMRRKAAKVDIGSIEYALADLDPNEGESSSEAKGRYMSQLKTFAPAPTAIVDSGNGIQLLWRLNQPINLGKPMMTGPNGRLTYLPGDQAKIDDVENRVKSVMEKLGSKAGTQNIDRILRLPGTLNLPNAKKRAAGREDCHTQLIFFDKSTYPLADFPSDSVTSSPSERIPPEGPSADLPPALQSLLHLENTGAYRTRSELLFAFLLGAIGKGINDKIIVDACLDPAHEHCSIYEHCHENKGKRYVEQQIAQARTKASFGRGEAKETRPLTIRSIDQFEARDIKWLWWPFFPAGMITTLYGDGEVGKSTIAIDVAARITEGRAFPRFGDEPEERAPKGSVLILSKEDDISLIIRPRLEAVGADISRVYTPGYDPAPGGADYFDMIERLDTNAKDLEGQVAKIGDVRLVIIDPITDYLGKLDMYRDDQVRALLNPIGRIAAQHDLAVINILHMNKKTDQAARYRGMGSIAFRNVSRSTVLVANCTEEPGRRLMMLEKKNLTAEKRAVGFRMRTAHAQPRVEWERECVEADVDAVLNGKMPKQRQAAELLRAWLEEGPVRATEIRDLAKSHGLSHSTLKLAKAAIGVVSTKNSDGTWSWRLPA